MWALRVDILHNALTFPNTYSHIYRGLRFKLVQTRRGDVGTLRAA